MKTDYKRAGVDIHAGDAVVERIKELAKSTFTPGVLSGIGHFGAFFKLPLDRYKQPVLVSSVDGVGTKLKIAIQTGIHTSIGQCLVNHCVNDIAVCGAEPLYFMDYMAFGKLNPEIAADIIAGFSKACRENGVALIGGETAEMPGLYAEEDYDISGTIVGVVEQDNIIDGNKIRPGDLLIAIPSSGLHTNGYSLARKILLAEFSLTQQIPEFGCTLGEELLKVHLSYYPLIKEITKEQYATGLAHITGGGIVGNTSRILQKNLALQINWDSLPQLPVFNMIQHLGSVPDAEMRMVFNMGVGLVITARKEHVDAVLQTATAQGHKPFLLGEVISA